MARGSGYSESNLIAYNSWAKILYTFLKDVDDKKRYLTDLLKQEKNLLPYISVLDDIPLGIEFDPTAHKNKLNKTPSSIQMAPPVIQITPEAPSVATQPATQLQGSLSYTALPLVSRGSSFFDIHNIVQGAEDEELIVGIERAQSLAKIVVFLLREFSKRQKIVVIMEDAQFVDTLSWELLHRVVCDMPPNLFIIVTFEPMEKSQQPAIFNSILEMKQLVQLLILKPVKDDNIVSLAEHIIKEKEKLKAAVTLSQDLKHTILELSDGNPFFVSELVKNLMTSKTIVVQNNQAGFNRSDSFRMATLRIPSTIESMITTK